MNGYLQKKKRILHSIIEEIEKCRTLTQLEELEKQIHQHLHVKEYTYERLKRLEKMLEDSTKPQRK